MKTSYLNSESQAAVSLRPSKAICLLLMVLFFVNTAFGQITQPLAWAKAFDQTSLTGTGVSFPIAAGTNRILVVGITTTFNVSDKSTEPSVITYGGVTLTKATGNGGTKGRMHTWLYFLKDNAVMDATSRPLVVTGGTVSGETLANMTVWYSVYAGVDQIPLTYTTGNGFDNNEGNGPAQLSAKMQVDTNDQAVYISNIYNDNTNLTPNYTINSNWKSGGSNNGSNGGNNKGTAWKIDVSNRTIPASNTTDAAATSAITPDGNIRYAMSAMSLPKFVPTITSLDSTGGCEGTQITINGSNFGTVTATDVKIGGTPVTSIVSNTNIQIVALIGSGTTGNVTVTNSGGTATSSSEFTVIPLTSAPAVGAITQPNCVTSTGSVVLSGLPSTGSWTLFQNGILIRTGTGTSTTVSGLSPQTYTYSVSNSNNGTGLKGEYFNNKTLSGIPELTRTDATVDFSWGIGSPGAPINSDNFSVRWSGQIQPLYSETYTFTTSSDDGIRLWVNGTRIINNWDDHSATNDTGTITLIAGVKYNIVLEYYEHLIYATSKLSWNSTSQALQIIPQSQLYSVDSCASSASANVVINAQPALTTPAAGAITQPDCKTATGSVVLSGLPAGNWTINQTGTVITSYPIIGTTMIISELAVGTYKFSISNGSCSSSATGDIVINASKTATWNGTTWTNGPPTASQALEFSGDYSSSGDLTACSCKVTGSKTVIIKPGHTLTITNEVTVIKTGSLTFDNNASLVQINNVANSGNIIYKRTTSSVLNSDYTYWSSPVAVQKLNISPSYASGMFYSYNDFASPEDWKPETASTDMLVGKGYIIRGPQVSSLPPPPGLYLATFVGVPNNGTKTIAIGPNGTSNLLGNPYPSALDANEFLSFNSSVIEGTIYLWTHNTAIQLARNITNGTAGPGAYAYTSDDYATYNGTGGIGTAGNLVNGVPKTSNTPTGKIAAGQAFFTTSKANGTSVTFNNAMRLSSMGAILDNSQFFKTKKPNGKTTNAIEKNRVWLNLTNTEGAFKQTLVGYVTDATNDYDSSFDGESFDGNEFVDFYSVNQDMNLTIQGRALPFDENDEVPLGYRSTINGDFTINIDQVDGVLTNQAVFLEDKLTNTVTDLKSGNYTFNTTAGTFDERFVLKYTNKTLSVNAMDKEDGILVLYSNNYKTLIIQNNVWNSTVNTVDLYNISGQKISNWDVKDSEQTTIQIPIKSISSGIYIVKVNTTKGESSKKIIVN